MTGTVCCLIWLSVQILNDTKERDRPTYCVQISSHRSAKVTNIQIQRVAAFRGIFRGPYIRETKHKR